MSQATALMSDAEASIKAGDWDQALEFLESAKGDQGASAEVFERLAHVQSIRGRFQSAISTYLELVARLVDAEDFDRADEYVDRVLCLVPESEEARERRISIERKRGRIDQAVELSRELARLCIDNGDGDRSIRLLKDALAERPENLDISLELAEMFVSHGQIEDGANQYRRAANAFQEQGNIHKAAEAYRRMKVVQSDDPEVLLTLGRLYTELGKLDEAEQEFRSVLRHDLEHQDALMELGYVSQLKGRFRSGILAFKKVLQSNPDQVGAKRKLGELNFSQGMMDEAVEFFLEAAQGFLEAEDKEQAVELFQYVLGIDGGNASAQQNLANLGAPIEGRTFEPPQPPEEVAPPVEVAEAPEAVGGQSASTASSESIDSSTEPPTPKAKPQGPSSSGGGMRRGLIAGGLSPKPGLVDAGGGGKPMLGGKPTLGGGGGGGRRRGLGARTMGGAGGGDKPMLGGRRPMLGKPRLSATGSSASSGEAGGAKRDEPSQEEQAISSRETLGGFGSGRSESEEKPPVESLFQEAPFQEDSGSFESDEGFSFDDSEFELTEDPFADPEPSGGGADPTAALFGGASAVAASMLSPGAEAPRIGDGDSLGDSLGESIGGLRPGFEAPEVSSEAPASEDPFDFGASEDLFGDGQDSASGPSVFQGETEAPDLGADEPFFDFDDDAAGDVLAADLFGDESAEPPTAAAQTVAGASREPGLFTEAAEDDLFSGLFDDDTEASGSAEQAGSGTLESSDSLFDSPEEEFAEASFGSEQAEESGFEDLFGSAEEAAAETPAEDLFAGEPDLFAEPASGAESADAFFEEQGGADDLFGGAGDLFAAAGDTSSADLGSPTAASAQSPEQGEADPLFAFDEAASDGGGELFDDGGGLFDSPSEPGAAAETSVDLFGGSDDLFAGPDMGESSSEAAGLSEGGREEPLREGAGELAAGAGTPAEDDLFSGEDLFGGGSAESASEDLFAGAAGDFGEASGVRTEGTDQFQEAGEDLFAGLDEPLDSPSLDDEGDLFGLGATLPGSEPTAGSDEISEAPLFGAEEDLFGQPEEVGSSDDLFGGDGDDLFAGQESSSEAVEEAPDLFAQAEEEPLPFDLPSPEDEPLTLDSDPGQEQPVEELAGADDPIELAVEPAMEEPEPLGLDLPMPGDPPLRLEVEGEGEAESETLAEEASAEAEAGAPAGEESLFDRMRSEEAALSDEGETSDPAESDEFMKLLELTLPKAEEPTPQEPEAEVGDPEGAELAEPSSEFDWGEEAPEASFEEAFGGVESEFAVEPDLAEEPAPELEEDEPEPPEPENLLSPEEEAHLRDVAQADELDTSLTGADVATKISSYRRVLEDSPDNLVLRTRLADIHLKYGLLEDAVVQYRQILRRKSDSVELLHKVIQAEFWNENYVEAGESLFRLAKLHLERGESDLALDNLQSVLSLDPLHFEARRVLVSVFTSMEESKLAAHHLRQLAESAMTKGDVQEAISAFHQLLEISDDPSFEERLAQIYEGQGDFEGALSRFESLRERYLADERWEEAARVSERIVELRPEDLQQRSELIDLYLKLGANDRAVEQQHQLARLHEKAGAVEEAILLYERVVDHQGENFEARRSLVDVYLLAGKIPLALEQAKVLTEHYVASGDPSTAIELYTALVEADPENVELQERLVRFYTMAGDSERAKERWISLSQQHQVASRFDKAAEALVRALEIDPEALDLRFQLAQLYAQELEDRTSALGQLRQIFAASQEMLEAVNMYIDLLLQEDQVSEAGQVLSQLEKSGGEGLAIRNKVISTLKGNVEANPSDLKSRFSYGELCYHLGDLDHAIEQFQQTRRHPDFELMSYNMLGLSFAKKTGFNMLDLAIRQFKKGLELKGYSDTEYLELRYNLAMLQYQNGRAKEALAELKACYNVDITFRDVRSWIQKIEQELAAASS